MTSLLLTASPSVGYVDMGTWGAGPALGTDSIRLPWPGPLPQSLVLSHSELLSLPPTIPDESPRRPGTERRSYEENSFESKRPGNTTMAPNCLGTSHLTSPSLTFFICKPISVSQVITSKGTCMCVCRYACRLVPGTERALHELGGLIVLSWTWAQSPHPLLCPRASPISSASTLLPTGALQVFGASVPALLTKDVKTNIPSPEKACSPIHSSEAQPTLGAPSTDTFPHTLLLQRSQHLIKKHRLLSFKKESVP